GRASQMTTSVRFYLVAVGDNGKIGCGDSLIPVKASIPPTTAPLAVAMRRLLSVHSRYYGESGLYNALYQSRLTVKRVTVINGRAVIHLGGTLRLGGECDNPRVSAQLKRTAFQFPTVHSVT